MAKTPSKRSQQETISRCIKYFDEDKKAHDRFCSDAEKFYRSYRGVLEKRSDAAQWTNKMHPPYVGQVLETMVAGLLDPHPRWRLTAARRFESPPEDKDLRDGAKALETLLRWQRGRTWSLTDQRTHRMQALITRLSVVKTHWGYEEVQRPRWQTYEEPLYDDFGEVYTTVPRMGKEIVTDISRDDPQAEVVDVRDFLWHEAAVSLDRAARVHHRLWMTFDELKRQEKTDDNPHGIYANVDQLRETRDFASDELSNREKSLFDTDRTKDQIEVIECWYDHGQRVATIANRRVLLSDRPNPFWHGHYPFVVCSGTPDMFRVPGISEVEMIFQLQEMMWTLQNQQLDNLQLLNNAIVLISSDVDDPDAFEFAPGEKWIVDRPDQVVFNRPEPITAELATGTLERLKGDLQAISGGMPWLSGDNRNSNTDTATEASILTTLAQRRIAAKKQFFLEADATVGDHFIELNDQFLTQERYVQIVGNDGDAGWQMIDPSKFRDFRFRIELEGLDESMMRQERRAEAQAKLQVALGAVQYFAAISGSDPATPMLNLKAFMDDFLEQFGSLNTDRFYSKRPAPQMQPQQQGQQQPTQPGGESAPQAYDANSPSNSFSQSPVAALARMQSASGGANNV